MIIAPPEPAARFSTDLRELAARFDGRPVRLADVLAATRGRGYQLLLLVVTLPFVGPVPLPGFSIPSGLAVAVIGLRLALHRDPWLPARLLNRELPPHFLAKTLRGVGRIVRGLEAVARPRWPVFSDREFFQRVAGILIGISGLFLILPLPLPLSNSLPAWTVILLSTGAIARDGVFLVAGALAFILTAGFFTLVAAGGRYALGHLLPWLQAG